MKAQIVKNLLSNYVGNLAGMLLGFLLIPFLIKKLGSEAYGISVLAESIIVFFQISAFSIRIALARYATVALSKEKHEIFIEYLATGKYILGILTWVTFFAGTCASYFFPRIFSLPSELNLQSQILFFLIVSAFSISIPNIIYWSVLYARQRFDLINYSNYGGTILRAIVIFLLFTFLPSAYVNLITYGIAYFCMTWAQNHIIFLWHKKIMPGLVIRIAMRDKSKTKEVISFAGYSSVSGTSAVIFDSAMNIIINVYMGPAYNTIYSISSKIPSVLKRLFLTPASSLAPTFAALVSKGDKRRLKLLFLFYCKSINVVVVPIAILLATFSDQIIFAWVGSGFSEASKVMPLFLLAAVLSVPASISAGVNNAYGNIRFPTIVTLFASMTNVALGILLGFWLGFGLVGVALSAILFSAAAFFLFMPLYCCREAGIPFKVYFWETVYKPLLLILPTWLALSAAFIMYNDLWTIAAILGSILILSILYSTLGYMFLLNAEEKAILIDLSKSARRKFATKLK